MSLGSPRAQRRIVTAASLALAAFVLTAPRSVAMYSSGGQGIQTVLSGTVANASLYMGTQATWINSANPAVGQPYNLTVGFAIPACDSIVNGRLVLSLWGGTANYTANLGVSVNGNALMPGGLNLGSTNDANVSFSATQPSVYGSGFGVWLVGLPVNTSYLHSDGSSNTVTITVTTPDSFDGRIHQVSLLSVYQQGALTNQFQYAIAEGSGDIYASPTSVQVSSRVVPLGGLSFANPNAATLHALYTYGDSNQNDRIYFNGAQFGSDDIARWNPSPTGLNFGPDVVSFDVLSSLTNSGNQVTFSVGPDVPGTRETSLRPQLAVLTVTGAPVLTSFQQWQMQYFNCTNCPQAAAAADPDGDGISNTNEFLSGTVPTNSVSALRIVSMVLTGNDVQVTWKTSGGDPSGSFGQGKTNVLEYTAGDAMGGFTNSFVSTGITNVITTLGDVLTNAIDPGGATNRPARYYRVRVLVP